MAITAPYDADGVPVPTGWMADKTVDPDCAACGATCARIVRTALSIPGAPYGTPAVLALDGQDPDAWARAWYRWDRYREMLQWLYQGQPFADSGRNAVSNEGGNFSDVFDVKVSAVDGERVEIDPTYASAHKLSSRAGETIHVQPGDMIRMGGCEGMVVRADPDSSDNVYLHRAIAVETPILARVYREMDRPDYPYLAPWRGLWVQRHTTGWIPSGDVGAGYTLRMANGVNGRIAWPYPGDDWCGTFRVQARTVGGDVVDVTDTVLAHFGSADPWLSFDTVAGAYQTSLDLSALTLANGYVHYKVDYCPEVASQADPGAGGVTAFRPTQSACRYALRDWSDSIRTYQDGVSAGWADDSTGRWFCAHVGALTESGTPRIPEHILEQFTPQCNLAKCPYHALGTPWRPSSAAVAAMLVGRDKYVKRQGPYEASPPTYLNGRAQQPSLHWIIGCPVPSHDTEQPPLDIAWYGVGGWGILEDEPGTGGRVQRIATGAIAEGGGVLASATYPDKGDRAGGQGPDSLAQYDDGSDWLEIESAHPSRRMASIGMGGETAQADGDTEAAVQRVRRHPLIVSGLRVGEAAEVDGITATWDGAMLRLTIPALGATAGAAPDGRPFPVKDVPAIVDHAQMDGGLLWINWRPGVVKTQSIGSESAVSTWLASGATVSPPPWLEIRNPISGARNRYQALTERLCRGDTVRFPDLAGLGDVRLTCVYAKAFDGTQFSGTVYDPDLETDIDADVAPEMTNVPEWYATQSQRLAMDVAAFDVSGHLAAQVADVIEDLPGLSATVDSAAVFPPLRTVVDSVATPTDYDVGVIHHADGNAGSFVVAFVDPANGVIDIDASGWDAEAVHCLEAVSFEDEGPPYRVTRENTLPAELIDALQAGHEAAQWCRAGGFGDALSLGIRPQWAWGAAPSGQFEVAPADVTLRQYWPTAGGDFLRTWPESINNPRVVPSAATDGQMLLMFRPKTKAKGFFYPDPVPPEVLEVITSDWDEHFTLMSDGSRMDGLIGEWAYSGPAGWPSGGEAWLMRGAASPFRVGVTVTWPFSGLMLHGAYQAYRFDLTPDPSVYRPVPPLRRWRSDWIAQALVDIKISGATRRSIDATVQDGVLTLSDTESGDLVLTLGLFAAEEHRLEDQYFEEASEGYGGGSWGPYGDAVRLAPLGLYTPTDGDGLTVASDHQDEWVTIDVTPLAKLAADAAAGRTVYEATLDGDAALALADMADDRPRPTGFLRAGEPLVVVTEEPTEWAADVVWYDESGGRFVFAPALASSDVEYSFQRDIYLAVVGAGRAGDQSDALASMDVNDLFWSSVDTYAFGYTGYVEGTPEDGGGQGAERTYDRLVCSSVQYDGVQFRDLKLRLDWDAFRESAHLPHIAYGPDGAAHWPVDLVEDIE
jgi:hypothetical protein